LIGKVRAPLTKHKKYCTAGPIVNDIPLLREEQSALLSRCGRIGLRRESCTLVDAMFWSEPEYLRQFFAVLFRPPAFAAYTDLSQPRISERFGDPHSRRPDSDAMLIAVESRSKKRKNARQSARFALENMRSEADHGSGVHARQVKISKRCVRRPRRNGTDCPDFGQDSARQHHFGAQRHLLIVESPSVRLQTIAATGKADTIDAALKEAIEHAVNQARRYATARSTASACPRKRNC